MFSKKIFSIERFSLFFLSCAFWLLLSGIFEVQMLIFMVISSIATVVITEKFFYLPKIKFSIRGFRYIPFMLKSMFFSSVRTTQILNGDFSKFHSCISEIKIPFKSNSEALMQASAITMTPGTVVISINSNKKTMLVHSLDKSLAESIPDKDLKKILCFKLSKKGKKKSFNSKYVKKYFRFRLFGEKFSHFLNIVNNLIKFNTTSGNKVVRKNFIRGRNKKVDNNKIPALLKRRKG